MPVMLSPDHGVLMIHHVTVEIPVNGEAWARRFYGELLGLREMAIPEALQDHERGGIWYEVSPDGSMQLHVGPVDDFHPQRRGHPALLIHHLDALRASLQQQGVTIEEAIAEPGWKRFYARDPFGTRLEFREPL